MMNREEFLAALRSRIAMLEQSEQEDILAEYAQHIEMQMKDGFSEEEAIRDFGPLDELTAEILEAYHIDPEYTAHDRTAEPSKAPKEPVVRPALTAAGGWVQRIWKRFLAGGRRFGQWLTRGFHWLGRKCREGWTWLKGLFHRRPKIETVEEESVPKTEQSKKEKSPILPVLKRNWAKGVEGVKQMIKAMARLAWNCALILCALPLFCMAFLGLIALGLLLVLLFQGYPLIGVTLAVLGGLLFCGALLGLFWTWIWHRQKAIPVSSVQRETVQLTDLLSEQIGEVVSTELDAVEKEENDHE